MRALTAISTFALTLLLVAPAFASDNGEGLYGQTDDKVITFFSLGVVVFFAVLMTVLSIFQARLERRKEEREALDLRRRVGW